ncbi:DUF4160 domain-containing protein [Edwardsiella ictaluri]|uniref:DUF4160 domain-containing protein n=1 Tax=Edwardsiella ictaluri TaxID=67780 RepID=UPI0018DB2FBF|nr:DUF4160 domain-containing protein [Edwardsiella ictaluri]QPW28837.1 DUF4160 domain-containing protein [Edwardsiella ictaluri]UYB61953.1 DUF4160 domain-containing protein [Edwardsiella ictaluri]UYB65178.1 DUF4160 domain-containing protein [Edwardsiella ictaluri]WJH19910.1 DUF4160 domain-containing protein [Edwardsiella ictaluri]BEH97514.1 DUF4160 domain-containing protein [Edwardsiella ictaluri]
MPTVLRIGAYRFYFYSHEPNEPAHVHIDKGNATAKIWLHDISVARSVGFASHELRELQRLVEEYQIILREAWDAYFAKWE